MLVGNKKVLNIDAKDMMAKLLHELSRIEQRRTCLFYEFCLVDGKFAEHYNDYVKLFDEIMKLEFGTLIIIGEEKPFTQQPSITFNTDIYNLYIKEWKNSTRTSTIYILTREKIDEHKNIPKYEYNSCELAEFACPLPDRLVDHLLDQYCSKIDLIIDLYSGSGKIVKRAMRKGFDFCASEINKEIYERSIEKIYT